MSPEEYRRVIYDAISAAFETEAYAGVREACASFNISKEEYLERYMQMFGPAIKTITTTRTLHDMSIEYGEDTRTLPLPLLVVCSLE